MTPFGIQLPNFSFPGVDDTGLFEAVVAMAVAAEEGRAHSLWVMDHFFQVPPLGGEARPMLEAYTLLGALAARTERVRLGALVTGVTYRNPAIVAKQLTTLDVISGGRAVLGMGAAWYEEEHRALGVDFPPVGERMDRLEEALRICRAMFRDKDPTFLGRYYRIDGAVNLPRPVQAGGPPIMVGGSGRRRTLRAVARFADMCNLSGGPRQIREHLGALREHCESIGRDPAEIRATRLGSLFPVASSAEARRLTERLLPMVGEEELAGSFTIGDSDAIGEQLRALVDAGLDELIFNLPAARNAGDVADACAVLVSALS